MSLQDRTEPATPRRREDARNEGKVCKSSDINSAVTLLASLLVFRVAGPYLYEGLTSLAKQTFSTLHKQEIGMDQAGGMMMSLMMSGLRLCMPIMLAAGAVAVTANVLQVGLKVTPKAIAWDSNRINPVRGIASLVSLRSAVELLKSLAKVLVVGIVVYLFLKDEMPKLTDLADMPVAAGASMLGGMCWRLLAQACIVLLVIAVLDYLFQRFQYEQSLKMTKQEVKEEYKRTEGDPAIKGRVRQRQRELARSRMVQAVPKADLVLVNPTHYAVALKYDPNEMPAPIVLAKGQRLMAQKIRDIASANGIPIIENPPVTRMIYKMVEVGQQIPEELYQTVAEILAYVYKLSERAGRAWKAA